MKIQVTFDIHEDTLLKESEQETLKDAIDQELGWLHDSGMYAESWEVLSPEQQKNAPLSTIAGSTDARDAASPANTVKLWARVGVTMEIPERAYNRLWFDKDTSVLQNILDGKIGTVQLDGETYFPDIEINRNLEEVEFTLPYHEKMRGPADLTEEVEARVYKVSGNAREELFSGSYAACAAFCEKNNWTHVDSYIWDLDLKPNPNLVFTFETAEYQDAVHHFSQQSGSDIDSHMIRANAEKLISCHQNQMDLLDFDFWCQYESILKEPITCDEYIYIDRQYDGDILEVDDGSDELIASLKTHLDNFRRSQGITAVSSKKPSSLDHRITGAKERQQNTSTNTKQHGDVDFDRS